MIVLLNMCFAGKISGKIGLKAIRVTIFFPNIWSTNRVKTGEVMKKMGKLTVLEGD